MGKDAARVGDKVFHKMPPILTGTIGSLNVFIGGKPAWRGVSAAAASALKSAKKASDVVIKPAEEVLKAAAGTLPDNPTTKIAEETIKAAADALGSTIASLAGGADLHMCATPLPPTPHGVGVVIDGSKTVLINGFPACRQGDTILEPLGPPNKITKGCPTVLIGD